MDSKHTLSDAQKWRKHQPVVQERFWCDLLYGRYVNMNFQQLCSVAEEFEISLREEACYVPIFFRLFTSNMRQRPLDPEATISKRNELMEQMLLRPVPEIPPITIHPRLCAAIHIMQTGETIGDLERTCSQFTKICKNLLGLNMVCILKGPMTVAELASSSNQMREFMDSVREQTAHVSADEVTKQIKAYLAANLSRRVGREELAALVHLNPDHMARLFLRQTGRSISEYIAQEKMNHACKQLAWTDDPISVIAMDLGYDNMSYFSKRFRQYTGMLPREYRRAHRTK